MARVEPYLADYGITRVAHLTFLDRVGIPVHTAHKPAGKSLSNGSGKGVTLAASRIGAIMEAIEQTYWEDCDVPRLLRSRQQLRADGIAHVLPTDVPMNRGNFWNNGLTIEWTPMTDLRTGAEVLVPADLVGLPWHTKAKRIAITHMCSSNGLASGNNFIEAVMSGLTEVMERDALAMTVAHDDPQSHTHSLDLSALQERHGDLLASLLDKVARAGLQISISDCTGDGGLPTYKCLISESTALGAGQFGGYGSSLDSRTAVVRAVTEAAQARCLIIAGARDDQFRCGRDASQLASRQARALQPVATLLPRDQPDLSTGGLCTDAQVLADMLAQRGMPQILVHRYTGSADPVQVVRIVVPKLEGYMFANYQPGPRAAAVRARQVAS